MIIVLPYRSFSYSEAQRQMQVNIHQGLNKPLQSLIFGSSTIYRFMACLYVDELANAQARVSSLHLFYK